MRILYVGVDVRSLTPSSGPQVVNKRNYTLLSSMFKENIDVIVPENIRRGIIYDWGGKKTFLKALEVKMTETHYDYVFLSQSLFGTVAKFIKERFFDVKLISFFHNIEIQYAKEFMRTSGLLHYPFYLSAKRSERKTVTYSDVCIVLNNRDARLLEKEYNRKADLVLPTSFEDKFEYCRILKENVKDQSEITYLFVGVAFFANIEAVRWFINKVLPFVPGTLIIVGKGMDAYAKEWETNRVKVFGFVNDLSEFYYEANFVVLPIFSGGGMKTKTAEALMFGKTIIGTTEAFEGYSLDNDSTILCNNSIEFIDKIKDLINQKKTYPYNEKSRKLFLDQYSYNSSKKKISDFLGQINE